MEKLTLWALDSTQVLRINYEKIKTNSEETTWDVLMRTTVIWKNSADHPTFYKYQNSIV